MDFCANIQKLKLILDKYKVLCYTVSIMIITVSTEVYHNESKNIFEKQVGTTDL